MRSAGAPGALRAQGRWVLLVVTALTLAACSSASPARHASPVTGQGSAEAQASPHPTSTVVALGASDAFGIGTDDPDRQNWPTVLASELGKPVHLINLGLPGATVAQAARADLPIALDAHPDVVTIWLAVNDFSNGVALPTYADQLRSLVAALRQGSHARIFVGNLPDLTLLPYFSGIDSSVLHTQVQAWNAAIAAVCGAEGAHLIDLYTSWGELASHPEYISPDGLHPSTMGAARLADLFAAAILSPGAP